jgi:hypothetical protein
MPNDVVQATRQPFDPGSSGGGCAADRKTSYVEGLWSPSLASRVEIPRLKQALYNQAYFPARTPRVFLSQAGPRFDLDFLKLGITL